MLLWTSKQVLRDARVISKVMLRWEASDDQGVTMTWFFLFHFDLGIAWQLHVFFKPFYLKRKSNHQIFFSEPLNYTCKEFDSICNDYGLVQRVETRALKLLFTIVQKRGIGGGTLIFGHFLFSSYLTEAKQLLNGCWIIPPSKCRQNNPWDGENCVNGSVATEQYLLDYFILDTVHMCSEVFITLPLTPIRA